ncbi:MAG: restriction endonuclease subunit S [Nitrosopumilaceae archaeon]
MPQISIIKESVLSDDKRIDAEYFLPQYIKFDSILNKTKTVELSDLMHVSDGNHLTVVEQYVETGIRYLRGKDLSYYFIENEDPVFITDSFFSTLKRSHMKQNDVLVSIVGTVGNVGIIKNESRKITGSCKLAILRSEKISPDYIYAFLLSKFGQFQIKRMIRGTIQQGLILPDLRKIKITLPNNSLEKSISLFVNNAYNLRKNADELYQAAENMLLSKLNIEKISFVDRLSYLVNFDEVRKNTRFDSEYYQPKFQNMINELEKNSKRIEPLGAILNLTKGIEVGSDAYTEEGIPFLRVSNITKFGIEYNEIRYINNEIYNSLKTKFKPKKEELLLTKDASIGIAYVVREEKDQIISGGILRGRLKTDIDIDYLALILNSKIGKLQIERDSSGSIIDHWRHEQIVETIIPILSVKTQQQIGNLVRESHKQRGEAKKMLEKATSLIEKNIENRSYISK